MAAVDFIRNSGFTYLNLGSAAATTMPLSIFCTFHANSISGNPALVSINDNSTFDGFFLGISGTSVQAAKKSFIFTDSALSAGVLNTTDWFTAGAVFDASLHTTAYANGVPGTTDLGTQVPSGLNDTYVGAMRLNSFLTGPFSGCIGRAAIWQGVALTDADALAYNNGVPPQLIQPGALVFYAPLVTAATREVNLAGAPLTSVATLGSFGDCPDSPHLWTTQGTFITNISSVPTPRRFEALIGPISQRAA